MIVPWLRTSDGILLHIHLQPRASRNQVLGLHGGALKIALTAPPVEGAANAALVDFLATMLHIPRSRCTLVGGAKNRSKRLLFRTAAQDELVQRLEKMLRRVDKKNRDD